MVDVRPILAETSFPSLSEKLMKDSIDRIALFLVRLVETKHAHKHSVSGVHEEVGHRIEALFFIDSLYTIIPVRIQPH